jgi:hypothetical protein
MERSTDRTRHWAAWAGTKEDVRRLGNAVARQADSRLKALVMEFDKKTDRSTDSVESFIWPVTNSDLTINSDTVLDSERMKIQDRAQKESRKQERERLLKNFQTVMTLVHGNDTTKGPIGQHHVLKALPGCNDALTCGFSVWRAVVCPWRGAPGRRLGV